MCHCVCTPTGRRGKRRTGFYENWRRFRSARTWVSDSVHVFHTGVFVEHTQSGHRGRGIDQTSEQLAGGGGQRAY